MGYSVAAIVNVKGKGVVSLVKPDNLMPRTMDGRVVDIQANICGV